MSSARSVASVGATSYYGGMPQRFSDPNKLKASEAIELLGVTRWKFFDLVERGIIRRHGVMPGINKLGYYRRDEIEALARRLRDAQPDDEER